MAWTKAEEKFLIENYKIMPTKQIAKHLKKSRHSVNGKKRRMGLVDANSLNKNTTLCVNCDNARADRCKWIRYGNPQKGVKGWKVTPTEVTISNKKEPMRTVRVDYCPKFVKARNAG